MSVTRRLHDRSIAVPLPFHCSYTDASLHRSTSGGPSLRTTSMERARRLVRRKTDLKVSARTHQAWPSRHLSSVTSACEDSALSSVSL